MGTILGFLALFIIYIIVGILVSKAAMLISSVITDIFNSPFEKYKGNSN